MPISTNEVEAEVLSSIKRKKPYSVIRCGEGELKILNAIDDQRSYKSKTRNHLGMIPVGNDQKKITDDLLAAIKNATTLGITPSLFSGHDEDKKKYAGTYWEKTPLILSQYGIDIERVRCCSMSINIEFMKNGFFSRISKHIANLLIISAHDVRDGLRKKHGFKEIEWLRIEPQQAYFNNRGEAHYPTQYDCITKKLNKNLLSEITAIVGAGFLGKHYCETIRKQGGVSLDVGSVFDFWAGFLTRGKGKGKEVPYHKYKI
ncbi:MAG: hypothetical protein Q8O94_02930 [bacterium]|nr:hypothetical protein [bacterium]